MTPSAPRGRVRGQNLSGPRPLLAVFALLIVVGIVVVVLAWRRAAGTELVPYQLSATLAAVVGLALIGMSLSVFDIHGGRRQEALEYQSLEALGEEVGRLRRRLVGRIVRND